MIPDLGWRRWLRGLVGEGGAAPYDDAEAELFRAIRAANPACDAVRPARLDVRLPEGDARIGSPAATDAFVARLRTALAPASVAVTVTRGVAPNPKFDWAAAGGGPGEGATIFVSDTSGRSWHRPEVPPRRPWLELAWDSRTGAQRRAFEAVPVTVGRRSPGFDCALSLDPDVVAANVHALSARTLQIEPDGDGTRVRVRNLGRNAFVLETAARPSIPPSGEACSRTAMVLAWPAGARGPAFRLSVRPLPALQVAWEGPGGSENRQFLPVNARVGVRLGAGLALQVDLGGAAAGWVGYAVVDETGAAVVLGVHAGSEPTAFETRELVGSFAWL